MIPAALAMLFALMPGVALNEQAILDGANARIARYRTGEAEIRLVDAEGRPMPEGLEVRIEQTRHAFLFGSNIFKFGRCRTPEDNAAYAEHFDALMNYATLPFYWWGYEREAGKPTHDRTREILAWCEEHRVTPKGHPLVWNWRDPRWLPEDLDRVYALQLDRIMREMKTFADDLRIWDVVNEASHPFRPDPVQASPRLSALIRREGVRSFVRTCFEQAREANPEAVLLINDYEIGYGYIDRVLTELVDEQGRPLYDVIGIQSHMHGGVWPVKTMWEACERFSRFGVPIHFTETTLVSGELIGWGEEARKKEKNPDWQWSSTPEGEQRQAEDVTRFYTVLFSHPSVEAITWWDFTDQGSWRRAPSGFLREDMTPKPAYHALRSLIRETWWTRTRAEVRSDGCAAFRGFYGDYRVTVEHDGKTLTGEFVHTKDAGASKEVRLQ